MKQYLLLMYQTGGCDYTIGCGYVWLEIEAKSKRNFEKAVNYVLNIILGEL